MDALTTRLVEGYTAIQYTNVRQLDPCSVRRNYWLMYLLSIPYALRSQSTPLQRPWLSPNYIGCRWLYIDGEQSRVVEIA